MSNVFDKLDVDPAELDGLSPLEAFVMGIEWAMFRADLASGKAIRGGVLAKNVKRLSRLAQQHGRFVEYGPEENGYCTITVGGER